MVTRVLQCLQDIEVLYAYRIAILLSAECIFYIDDAIVCIKIIVKNTPSSKDNIISLLIRIDP